MFSRSTRFDFGPADKCHGRFTYELDPQGEPVVDLEGLTTILEAWVEADPDNRGFSAPEDDEWIAGRRSVTVVEHLRGRLRMHDLQADAGGDYRVESLAGAMGEYEWFLGIDRLKAEVDAQGQVRTFLETWLIANPESDKLAVTGGYTIEQMEKFGIELLATRASA